MKKLLCLALALFMLFSFAACGDTLGLQRQINDLKDNIKELKDDNILLTDKIEDLEDGAAALTDRVSYLESELENLKKTEGLPLTISVDKRTLYPSEYLTLSATITNLTGISFYYFSGGEYPISWHIPNWILGIQPDVDMPEPRYWYFENGTSKTASFIIKNAWYDYDEESGKEINGYQNPGDYEITARALFSINFGQDNEEYIEVYSNTVNISVYAELWD